MTNTPDQTQIEPSAEAINKAYVHVNRRLAENYDVEQMSTLLAVAYAIDLAPIIAERDRMKAALELIQDRACDSNIDHYMVDFIYDACRAALEPKP